MKCESYKCENRDQTRSITRATDGLHLSLITTHDAANQYFSIPRALPAASMGQIAEKCLFYEQSVTSSNWARASR